MAIMLLYPICSVGAEPLRMVYNPFTGKMDYVTQLTSNTLPGGSTQYLGSIHVLDENVLQGNATSFNFTGTGVTCVLSGKVLTCTIPGGGVGGEPSFALFTTTGEPKIEAAGGFLLFRSTGQQKIEDAGGFVLFRSTGENGVREGAGFRLFQGTATALLSDWELFKSTTQGKIDNAAGFLLFKSTGEQGIREAGGFTLFRSTGESEVNRINIIQSQVFTIISSNVAPGAVTGIHIGASAIRSSHTNLSTDLVAIGSMNVVGSIISTSPIFGRQAVFSTMSVIGTITSTSQIVGIHSGNGDLLTRIRDFAPNSIYSSATTGLFQSSFSALHAQDESTYLGGISTINFTGEGVSASQTGGVLNVNVPGGGVGSSTYSGTHFQNESSYIGAGSTVNCTGAGIDCSQAGGVTTINVPGGGSLDPTAPITVGSMTSVGSITTTGTVISSQLNISTITFNRTLNTKNALPNKQDFSAGWQWVGSSYSSTAISTITVDMTGSTYAAYRFIFTTTATTPGTGRDVMMTFNGDFEKREARRYASSRRTLATLTSSSAARGILLMNISTTSNISVDATVLANPLNAPKVGKYDVTTMPERFWAIPVSSNTGIPTIIDGRFSWNDFTQQISSVSFSCIGGGITGGFFGPPVSLKVFGATEVVP